MASGSWLGPGHPWLPCSSGSPHEPSTGVGQHRWRDLHYGTGAADHRSGRTACREPEGHIDN